MWRTGATIMKLLITGGTGFIGSHLALQARAQGHEIVVAGLANTAAESGRVRELQSAGVVVEQGRLQSADFTRGLVKGCDGVIHLAAAQHEANVPDAYFREVNVEATRVLLEESWRAGVKRFVYGSSIGVYGSSLRRRRHHGHQGTALIDESTPTRPENIYARTKLEAEQCVRTYGDKIATTVVRISETYGPGDRRLLKLFRAVDRGLFVMIGAGENLRQLIHVHDLVRGLLLVLEHPAATGKTFVLAGPAAMSTRCMVEQIAAALGRSPRKWRIPLWPVEFAAATMRELSRSRCTFSRPCIAGDWISSAHRSASQRRKRNGCSASGRHPILDRGKGHSGLVRNHGLLSPSRRTAKPAALARKEGSAQTAESDVPLSAFNEQSGWRYSDILEFTHDAIIIWEMDGAGILYWNRAASQLYGYSREEALRRKQLTHLLLSTQLEGGVDLPESRIARYGIWVGNLRHRRRDGAPVIVQARLALMSQRNGRWLVLEVNRDVADRLLAGQREGTEGDAGAPVEPRLTGTLNQHTSRMRFPAGLRPCMDALASCSEWGSVAVGRSCRLCMRPMVRAVVGSGSCSSSMIHGCCQGGHF